jgi:DNA repair exonuclease SbcCD ATPase subunit
MTEAELPVPIRMERLEGQHNLLAQQVKTSADNVRNTLDNVQLEVRALSNKIDTLTDLRHSHDSNNKAVEDLKENIRELDHKIENWFNEISDDQKEKWDRHYRDRDKWRQEHLADNQRTKDTITRWSGVGFSLVLVGGAVVSGFVWSLNFRFNTAQAASERIEAQAARNRDAGEAMKDKLHQIELYLARGGVNPSQPYEGDENAEGS